jgi:hypothetical protein
MSKCNRRMTATRTNPNASELEVRKGERAVSAFRLCEPI